MEPEDLMNAYCNMFMPYWKLPPLPTIKRDKSGVLQFKSVDEKKLYEQTKNERIEIINHIRGVYPTDKLISYHPNSVNDLELETIVTKIRETVTRYDCKVVVFDNLLFACRGEKARELVDKFTQRFKLLARELNIVLICITHPKKTNHNKELENDDLKESSSIFQDADAVMLLHRPYLNEDNTNTDVEDEEESQDIMSEIMGIKVTARRGKGGRTKVIFRGEFNSIIDDREELFRVMALEAKYK
jgi:KaiC/GvpD/RAD55 family RecA-like ATPase